MERSTVKKILRLTVALSVGATITRLVRDNSQPTNDRQRAQNLVTGIAVGGVMSKHAQNWINEEVDYIADAVTKIKQLIDSRK